MIFKSTFYSLYRP